MYLPDAPLSNRMLRKYIGFMKVKVETQVQRMKALHSACNLNLSLFGSACRTSLLNSLRVHLVLLKISNTVGFQFRQRIYQHNTNPQRGFTLVEVLVAVALLGIIAAMVFASLVTTTQAVEAGRAHTEREQTIRKVLRLMAEEVSLSKRTITYPWVGMNGMQDGQPADILAFLAMSQELSSLNATVKEGENVRVVYTRERDRLIRFVRKNLYTLTDTNESLDQMELADRVQAFNVRYYDDQNRIWLDEWPTASKLPKALLIEVTFQYPDEAPWTLREWVTIGAS